MVLYGDPFMYIIRIHYELAEQSPISLMFSYTKSKTDDDYLVGSFNLNSCQMFDSKISTDRLEEHTHKLRIIVREKIGRDSKWEASVF